LVKKENKATPKKASILAKRKQRGKHGAQAGPPQT